MSTQVSRRSFLGAMLAIGASRALPQPPPVMADQPIEPEVIDVCELASTNATDYLRRSMRFIGSKMSADEAREMLKDADSLYEALARVLQPEHGENAGICAEVLEFAFECHATGYAPEQCMIDWPLVDGRRRMRMSHHGWCV